MKKLLLVILDGQVWDGRQNGGRGRCFTWNMHWLGFTWNIRNGRRHD